MNNRLLILDDDSEFTAYAGTIGRAAGYEVLEITEPTKFENTLSSWLPSHVMVDLYMPSIDGLEALQILARRQSAAKVVLCSAAGREFIEAVDRLGRRLKLNMSGVIEKPSRATEIEAFLKGLRDDKLNSVSPDGDFDRAAFNEAYALMGRDWVQRGLTTLITRCEAIFTEEMATSPERKELARSVHGLVSYAGLLGFSEVSRLCRAIEDGCVKGGNISPHLQEAQLASGVACAKAREILISLMENGANPGKPPQFVGN